MTTDAPSPIDPKTAARLSQLNRSRSGGRTGNSAPARQSNPRDPGFQRSRSGGGRAGSGSPAAASRIVATGATVTAILGMVALFGRAEAAEPAGPVEPTAPSPGFTPVLRLVDPTGATVESAEPRIGRVTLVETGEAAQVVDLNPVVVSEGVTAATPGTQPQPAVTQPPAGAQPAAVVTEAPAVTQPVATEAPAPEQQPAAEVQADQPARQVNLQAPAPAPEATTRGS